MAKASVVPIDSRHAAVLREFLGDFENIPDSPDRMNQRSFSIMVYFRPQSINMNIDHVCRGVDFHLPDLVQDHCASHNATCIATEVFQKHELLRRQTQWPI